MSPGVACADCSVAGVLHVLGTGQFLGDEQKIGARVAKRPSPAAIAVLAMVDYLFLVKKRKSAYAYTSHCY